MAMIATLEAPVQVLEETAPAFGGDGGGAARGSSGQPAMAGGPRSEIIAGSEGYPALLAHVEDPPRRLYVIGDETMLGAGLAIVGARKATPYGVACAERFASIAAQLGITVISGGAMGCDQAAHRGALAGGGKTVVVLGCGADVVYPRRGKELFERIVASGGALVSEQPWGVPPQKFAFRKRNRIIAGLARAVLIVEAGLPSGTFSTADYALETGRDVLAVPGSIFSRESRGSNRLLRDGAIPIVDDESLIAELERIFHANTVFHIDAPSGQWHLSFEPTLLQSKMLTILAASPQSTDDLLDVLDVSLMDAIKNLSFMESKGAVARYPDGRFGLNPAALGGAAAT